MFEYIGPTINAMILHFRYFISGNPRLTRETPSQSQDQVGHQNPTMSIIMRIDMKSEKETDLVRNFQPSLISLDISSVSEHHIINCFC